MSWGTDVVDVLRENVPSSDAGATVEIDGWAVKVDADAAGAVGCAADSLRARGPASTDLAETGRALAGRVDYLLEPLRLLEVGEEQALLRSAPPTVGSEANEYYEVWLEDGDAGTEVDLRRYRYDKTARTRETTPINLTWETAGRLLDDVRGAVETSQ